MTHALLHKSLTHHPDDIERFFRIASWKDGDDFVTPEAVYIAARTQNRVSQMKIGSDCSVPGIVAQAVVEALHAVHIHEHREWAGGAGLDDTYTEVCFDMALI